MYVAISRLKMKKMSTRYIQNKSMWNIQIFNKYLTSEKPTNLHKNSQFNQAQRLATLKLQKY